jgi:hypothetical protein
MRSKTPAVPAGLKGASTCGGVQERIGASRPLSGQGRRLNKKLAQGRRAGAKIPSHKKEKEWGRKKDGEGEGKGGGRG